MSYSVKEFFYTKHRSLVAAGFFLRGLGLIEISRDIRDMFSASEQRNKLQPQLCLDEYICSLRATYNDAMALLIRFGHNYNHGTY